MNLLLPILIVAATAGVLWSLTQVLHVLRNAQSQAAQARTLQILTLLAPAVAAAADDPQALLAWHPLAATARALFPDDFAAIDKAAGGTFPFTPAQIERAHARWTADWLAWEQTHEHSYKLKAALAEAEMPKPPTPLGRARLDAVEREKLEMYQARYGQYVRVSKAIQALLPPR